MFSVLKLLYLMSLWQRSNRFYLRMFGAELFLSDRLLV